MTISVRFAPSPTGYIHIGNLRAALLNFLYARKHGGRFWLRLDDTDNERSRPEYAANIEQSLGWAGITWDRFTRQSDRLAEYEAAAQTLKAAGRLYPAYETAEELALKRKARLAQGLPPIYDRAALNLSDADVKRYEAEGRKPHWRFKLAPGTIEWPDIIHGMLKFDAATMSDPVLIREDGSPLFILSGVVDDAEFGITHIIRGDDHITNTAVQIQIFEALGAPIPVFAHFSQLVDTEGGKLSKRKGTLGIMELQEQGYEPLAIVSLLARLGTADPIEARTSLQDVIDGFELGHFSKSPARLDFEELDRINARILHAMPFVDAQPRLTARGMASMEESFWLSVRGNLEKFTDIDTWWQVAEGPVRPVMDDPEFMTTASELLPDDVWNEQTWGIWTNALKERTGRTGKLLFMPLRLALTGQEHGPEMRVLLPLIGRERALDRLNSQNKQRSIVLSIIDNAFNKTIPPSVDNILEDGYFVESMRKVLTGAPWQDLTPEDVAKCRDTGYLTPQGFLYYLPAFLRLIVQDPEAADIMGEQVLWSLAPSNSEFCQEMFEYFQRNLLDEQRHAIREFFLYMWSYERRWLDSSTDIKAVTEIYWGETKATDK